MLLIRYWCTKCEFREPFGLDHFKWAKNFLLSKKKTTHSEGTSEC